VVTALCSKEPRRFRARRLRALSQSHLLENNYFGITHKNKNIKEVFSFITKVSIALDTVDNQLKKQKC